MRVQDILTTEQLNELRKRSPLRASVAIAHAWLIIFLAMAMFVWWPNPLTFLLATAVIGARQLGLAILMHDGSHGLLYRHRQLNHHVSQWLLGWPIGADMPTYRKYHLKHHARTQQPDDPDLVLSAAFPITRQSFFRKIWRDITGRTGLSQRTAQIRAGLNGGPVLAARLYHAKDKLGGILCAHVALLALLALAGYWWLYPALWLFPLLTFFQLFLRLRNIAEHAQVGDADDPYAHARTTLAGPLTRAFLAPYWVNYHVEHHLLMAVPCYRLPLCHQYLMQSEAGEKMLVAKNYLDVFRLITSRSENDDQQGERKQTERRRFSGLVMEEDSPAG